MMHISASLSIGPSPLLKRSFGACASTSNERGKTMHSYNQTGSAWLRMEARAQHLGPGLGLPSLPNLQQSPHSLSPRVFWRRSCLACSLVMRFLPSRYSFIFCKAGGQRTIRLLKEKKQNHRCSAVQFPF